MIEVRAIATSVLNIVLNFEDNTFSRFWEITCARCKNVVL